MVLVSFFIIGLFILVGFEVKILILEIFSFNELFWMGILMNLVGVGIVIILVKFIFFIFSFDKNVDLDKFFWGLFLVVFFLLGVLILGNVIYFEVFFMENGIKVIVSFLLGLVIYWWGLWKIFW